MRAHRINSLIVGAVVLMALSGCASAPADVVPLAPSPGTSTEQEQAPGQDTDVETDAAASEVTIPSGAYAASGALLFPVPEGWAELDPFEESKLGKDVTVSGSVEYPGDAKDAAATYLAVLKAAGFNAYTYAPGELTNPASLAAEGLIGGIPHFALLNFNVHADGYQRVSIVIVEED